MHAGCANNTPVLQIAARMDVNATTNISFIVIRLLFVLCPPFSQLPFPLQVRSIDIAKTISDLEWWTAAVFVPSSLCLPSHLIGKGFSPTHHFQRTCFCSHRTALQTEIIRRTHRGTPWGTRIYETYCDTISAAHVVLVDLYAYWAKLAKSGIQFATFVRVLLSNIWPHTEKWFKVGIVPSSKAIPISLPAKPVSVETTIHPQVRLSFYSKHLYIFLTTVSSFMILHVSHMC